MSDEVKDLQRAEELLQELADVIKAYPEYEYDELHYRIVSFLSRRGRVYP